MSRSEHMFIWSVQRAGTSERELGGHVDVALVGVSRWVAENRLADRGPILVNVASTPYISGVNFARSLPIITTPRRSISSAITNSIQGSCSGF